MNYYEVKPSWINHLYHRPIVRKVSPQRAMEIAATIPGLVVAYAEKMDVLFFGQAKENAVVVYLVDHPSHSLRTHLLTLETFDEISREEYDG